MLALLRSGALALLTALLLSTNVWAAALQPASNYALADPGNSLAWGFGAATGYSEGEVAAFSIGFTGSVGVQYTFTACFDYERNSNGAYAYTDIKDFDTDWSPAVRGTAINSRLGGVAVDTHAVLDSVSAPALGGACGGGGASNWIGVDIAFTVLVEATSGAGQGYIYIGALLAEPGQTTAIGDVVGASEGVSNWGLGNIGSKLEGINGNRTVVQSPAAVTPRADLSVVTTCPNFFASPPYTYQSVVSNSGASPANNLELVYTLPSGVTYTGFNSTPTSSCSASGQVVTCTLSSLAVGSTWTINMQTTLNSGASGSLTGTVTSLSSDETDPVPANNTDTCASTTPVVTSYFKAVPESDGGVAFRWRAEAETDVVGYNILADTDEGRVTLNAEPIPVSLDNGLRDYQDYRLQLAGVDASAFYLEALHGNGLHQASGPYEIGRAVGTLTEQDPIPWADIREGHEVLAVERQAELTAQSTARLSQWRDARIEGEVMRFAAGGAQLLAGDNDVPPPPAILELLVDEDGIQRVRFEDMAAAGFDLRGVPAADLALTMGGEPVAMRVASGPFFGAGSFIEFVGEAARSLYTEDNVYRLHLDPGLAQRVAVSNAPPSSTGMVEPTYVETAELARQRYYRTWSSGIEDPWIDTDMLVFGSPGSWSFPVEVEGLQVGMGGAQLEVEIMGATQHIANPDHHFTAELNGLPVADFTFDGSVQHVSVTELPDGFLTEGSNTVVLTNPADLGVSFDYAGLEAIRVHYPRAFGARDGRLDFVSAGQHFQVTNLPSSDVVVYQRDDSGVTRIAGVGVSGRQGAYAARFDGVGLKGEFWVASSDATIQPEIQPARPDAGIDQGAAQVLVISHADFIPGLAPWQASRESQGFQVRIVDIADVVARFGHGVYGAEAVSAYVQHAAAAMGTEYVMLVGADHYDYLGYLGTGAISFVPTPFTPSSWQVKYAPADPGYGDLDGDGVPDVAVGRWPVRTPSQLDDLVQRTLTYDDTSLPRNAVFAADLNESYANFGADSDAMEAFVPGSWQVDRAHLDTLGVGGARAQLLQALNAGARVASYVGHSSTRTWTQSGLFSATDAMNLQNAGRPSAVFQWGCWNTYTLSPAADSMGHRFLLSGDRGAALVMGATALTRSDGERELGKELMPRIMTPGATVGQAIIAAKHALDARMPGRVDVQAGWALLGDPTTVIRH
jgi:hypothetical protein